MIKDKKGLELSELLKWLIGVVLLVILVWFINSLATGRLPAIWQSFVETLRFGR